MHQFKEQASQEIMSIIEMTCNEVLCPKEEMTSDTVHWVLSVDKEKTREIIHKIVNAMPDTFFLNQSLLIQDDLRQLTAKEFILFQCQEDVNDENYSDVLVNFIYDLINQLNLEVFRGKGY